MLQMWVQLISLQTKMTFTFICVRLSIDISTKRITSWSHYTVTTRRYRTCFKTEFRDMYSRVCGNQDTCFYPHHDLLLNLTKWRTPKDTFQFQVKCARFTETYIVNTCRATWRAHSVRTQQRRATAVSVHDAAELIMDCEDSLCHVLI